MENTILKTVSGYTIVLKPYITGKDKRYIMDSFLEDSEVSSDGKFKMAPGKIHIAEDRSIETVVISVDGDGVNKAKTILAQVLLLPLADFNELIKSINNITESKKKEQDTPKI